MAEQGNMTVNHLYPEPERVRVKVEKNSKGFNFEVSVAGQPLAEVLETSDAAVIELKARYGGGDV